jgi:uncharacterized protein with HEPN domain
MSGDDRDRLQHMADAAREAIDFARGKDPQNLADDRMLLLCLVKEIEIIGKAPAECRLQAERLRPIFREAKLRPYAIV